MHGCEIMGTTAHRPTNAPPGATYYDTTTSELLVWNGSAWVTGMYSTSPSVAAVTGTATPFPITGKAGAAGVVGGTLALAGGVPVSGNAAGGPATVAGGAGSGTGAGGVASITAGASGAGATGNGGAVSAVGGAAASTNGSGGAAAVTGGAATGTGTGGAVTITGGASAGASGTAGAVSIDTGAATGGTGAAVTIGGTNATSIIFGSAETHKVGASTAAAGSTNADAAALPAGTAPIYPTTAADGTKGVILSTSDKVTGRMVMIGNGVSNAILKVYPPSGGTINGASANVAFSSASGKGVIAVCLSSGSNTWLAW